MCLSRAPPHHTALQLHLRLHLLYAKRRCAPRSCSPAPFSCHCRMFPICEDYSQLALQLSSKRWRRWHVREIKAAIDGAFDNVAPAQVMMEVSSERISAGLSSVYLQTNGGALTGLLAATPFINCRRKYSTGEINFQEHRSSSFQASAEERLDRRPLKHRRGENKIRRKLHLRNGSF